jgi:hypothetical protein
MTLTKDAIYKQSQEYAYDFNTKLNKLTTLSREGLLDDLDDVKARRRLVQTFDQNLAKIQKAFESLEAQEA